MSLMLLCVLVFVCQDIMVMTVPEKNVKLIASMDIAVHKSVGASVLLVGEGKLVQIGSVRKHVIIVVHAMMGNVYAWKDYLGPLAWIAHARVFDAVNMVCACSVNASAMEGMSVQNVKGSAVLVL